MEKTRANRKAKNAAERGILFDIYMDITEDRMLKNKKENRDVFDNALTEAFHTCKKDIKKSPQRASLFRQAFMDMVDIWIEATLCIVPKERAERLQEGADEWKLNIINKLNNV
jgi:hypothetical protein